MVENGSISMGQPKFPTEDKLSEVPAQPGRLAFHRRLS